MITTTPDPEYNKLKAILVVLTSEYRNSPSLRTQALIGMIVSLLQWCEAQELYEESLVERYGEVDSDEAGTGYDIVPREDN